MDQVPTAAAFDHHVTLWKISLTLPSDRPGTTAAAGPVRKGNQVPKHCSQPPTGSLGTRIASLGRSGKAGCQFPFKLANAVLSLSIAFQWPRPEERTYQELRDARQGHESFGAAIANGSVLDVKSL